MEHRVPNMTSRREVVSLLDRYGLKPHRGLGQNFLVDGNTINKIVEAAEINPGEAVVEIGPGAGALTLCLARRGARILALELDRGLVKVLQELLQPFPEAKAVQGDAMAADWRALFARYFSPGEPVKLLSNLPYYLSSPLVYALFKQKFPFARAVLMFQKEVAQRLTARPGESNYGGLSVLCRYHTRGRVLFKVSRQVFWPRPRVDSAVVELLPRAPELEPEQELLFWQLVQGAFQHRRKTVLNSLLSVFDWPRDKWASLLREASIDAACRPETLAAGQFANLSRIIYNYISTGK